MVQQIWSGLWPFNGPMGRSRSKARFSSSGFASRHWTRNRRPLRFLSKAWASIVSDMQISWAGQCSPCFGANHRTLQFWPQSSSFNCGVACGIMQLKKCLDLVYALLREQSYFGWCPSIFSAWTLGLFQRLYTQEVS